MASGEGRVITKETVTVHGIHDHISQSPVGLEDKTREGTFINHGRVKGLPILAKTLLIPHERRLAYHVQSCSVGCLRDNKHGE
jgi:hypothetical protein